MTTLDDLRRTLEGHAELAPDATGLVEAARVGAVRVRRRRRITAVITAAVVVVAAVAVPVAWQRNAAPPAPTATEPPKPPRRGPGETTISVDPGAGFWISGQQASTFRQTIEVSDKVGKIGAFQAEVQAAEPGVKAGFAHSVASTSERVTVQGQEALYVREPLNMPDRPGLVKQSLEWTDPTGISLEVAQANLVPPDRPKLMKLAEAVRVGAARALKTPFRLGPLPFGLQLASVGSARMFMPGGELTLTLPPARNIVPVEIETLHKSTVPTVPRFHDSRPAAPVAGHRAWSDTYRSPSDVLTVDVGACWIRFTKSKQLTADQLHEIADHTTYFDCTRESSWMPPVG